MAECLDKRLAINKAKRARHPGLYRKLVLDVDAHVEAVPCRDPKNDPDWWSLAANSPGGELAIRFCKHKCPVADHCLEYALRVREPLGIWGGMSLRQRTELLKKRDRQRRVA